MGAVYYIFAIEANRNFIPNLSGLLITYCVNLHLAFVETIHLQVNIVLVFITVFIVFNEFVSNFGN